MTPRLDLSPTFYRLRSSSCWFYSRSNHSAPRASAPHLGRSWRSWFVSMGRSDCGALPKTTWVGALPHQLHPKRQVWILSAFMQIWAMNFVQRFTFLFSAPSFEAEDLEGMRVAEIIAAIQRNGFQVIRARRIEDAEMAVQTDAAIGCLVVDWGKKGLEGKAASLINVMRRRGRSCSWCGAGALRTCRSRCSTSSTAMCFLPKRRPNSSPAISSAGLPNMPKR